MKKHLLRSMLVAIAMVFGASGAWAADPDLENDYTLVKSVDFGDAEAVDIACSGNCAYTAYDTGNKKQQTLTILTAPADAAGWIAMQGWTNVGTGKGWWNRPGQSLYCVNAQRSAAVFGDDLTTGWLVVFECKNQASAGLTLTNASGAPDGTFTYTASEDGKSYYCTITAETNAYVGFCGIKNSQGIMRISVYKPNKAAVQATYTVRYVDQDNEELKEPSTKTGIAGQAPTLDATDKANIVVEDMTFVYKSDDAAEQLINEDGSTVVTAKFDLAQNFTYTVVEACNGTAVRTTEGTNIESAKVIVPFRKYNMLDGQLYSKGANNKEYNYSFTLTADAQTETLAYSAVDGVTDVVFLSEGEDIEGLTPITTGNTAIRSSNSASAYAKADTKITTLPAGKYKLHAIIYDSASKPNSNWTFLAGAIEAATFNCTTVNIQEFDGEFAIGKETDIIFKAAGGSSRGLDALYIVKTGDVTEEEAAALNEAAKWPEALAAAEALVDADAVAVGLLEDAIAVAKEVTEPTDADYAALEAAVEQFKENNKDQEKDETAKVDTKGWLMYNDKVANMCSTSFAPAITTYDGRTAQLAEVFEGNGNRTGTIIYQNITGLTNGKYKVGFYGNAFSTVERDGFECTMEDGAEDVAYVFANDKKSYIAAHIAMKTDKNDFRQFDVEVTDGQIKLGMGKDKDKSTNWHTMQIYQLTWFTTAKEVFAADQAVLEATIAEAKALAADDNKTAGKDELNAAIEVAESAVGTTRYNIAEVEEFIANLKKAVADFKKANYFIDFTAGAYYIIDAESGLMMAAGNNYGTRGIVNETGLDLTLTPNEETRTVTIDSRVSNGGNNQFLGNNLYMDSSAYGWALEYQGFGFFIVDPASGQYINLDKDNNLVMSATGREFIIVSAEGVLEERMNELAEATAENPVDATFLLQNPNFNRNDLRVQAWKVEFVSGDNYNLNGGNQTNNCAESFHAAFTVSQVAANAPKGTYALTAQGFFRQDDNAEEAAPMFFMNDAKAEVPVKTGAEDNMNDASASFANGLYTIEPIQAYIGEGETLTVGVTNGENVHQWVIFDNFRLTYYGVEDLTTGITEVSTDALQAVGRTYNMAGQRVEKPMKGLYIQNGKKMVVK
ncbi:MAG: MucBP domain-containing protein [Prevotella sp.]|nr:MucBP domain-containing protein [Prevotella sp.]